MEIVWRCVMTASRMEPGRLWAWAALLVGGGVSLGANLGHSYIPPAGAAVGWSPSRWSLAWAAAGPILLFFTVKLLSHVRWPRGWRFALWRWFGALPVAGLAAYVSWAHISGLLAFIGEDRAVRILGPLAVDGLMLVAVGALMATTSGQNRIFNAAPPPPMADRINRSDLRGRLLASTPRR